MSGGYSPKNVQLWEDGSSQVFSGVLTNQPVSREFPITNGGSLNFLIKAKATAVTQVGTITLKLQSSINGDWVDAKSASALTAASDKYITLNIEVAGDQAALPLMSSGRLVISQTNASDSTTVSLVSVLQEIQHTIGTLSAALSTDYYGSTTTNSICTSSP